MCTLPSSLKAAYEKYKNKGFTILSISVDADKNKWEKALKEEKLAPIPDNFLVGPDGKILGRRIEGAALDAKLAGILK